MEDLRLHRLLEEPDADPEGLASLLAELAGREPHARGPWVGMLELALQSADARVRAGAVRALGGVAGRVGVAAIVRALDDGDEGVRAAAARAMLRTAQNQPQRIAHVVFHPREDVRRAAYDAEIRAEARSVAAHRLADPGFGGNLASLHLAATPTSVALVIDLVAKGRVPEDDARAWLREGTPQPLAAWADAAPRRSADEIARVLDSQGTDQPGQDRLDVLFRLFGAAAPAALRERFIRAWWAQVAGRPRSTAGA